MNIARLAVRNTSPVLLSQSRCLQRYSASRSCANNTASKLTVFYRTQTLGQFGVSHRLFSKATKASPATTSRWQRLAQVIRFVRIPLVVVSVYTLGYQQGVMDCTKEPKTLEKQLTTGILVRTGCDEYDDITILPATQIAWSSTSPEHRAAALVGEKIIHEAHSYVRFQLQEATERVTSKLPPTATEQERSAALASNETVDTWRQALLRLEGEDGKLSSPPWQYIFCPSSIPNAFVTELLPRRFFITSQLLELSHNSHELAVILGHEIAHMILGHNSAQNQVEFALRTTEVLLLSMDPTAGVLSMVFMAGVYAIRRAVAAAYSREHELAADQLGLHLAAAACFDTTKGVRILETLNNQSGSNSNWTLMDTHPPTVERFQKMVQLAKTVNYDQHPKCVTLNRRLYNALWGAA